VPAVQAHDAGGIVGRDTVFWKVVQKGYLSAALSRPSWLEVVSLLFANELHLRPEVLRRIIFESGWRTNFSRLGLIIAMSIRLKCEVKCLREEMTVEGN
jgi:hypothetical protein